MYVKLFSSLYQGTLRGRSDEILVFTNLLAHADQHGIVDKHWRAIAEETGLPRERVELAVINLEAPDPESRSPEMDGCRIVRMDQHRAWGWQIVNYGKYRALRNEDDRREQNRLAQEKWRNKNKPPSAEVSQVKPPSSQAEAEAYTEEGKSKTLRASRFDAQAHLVSLGVTPSVAEDWLKLRRAKRAPATKTAFDGVCMQAEKAGMTLDQALFECCSRNWASFKSEWMDTIRRNGNGSGTTSRQEHLTNVAAELTGRHRSAARTIEGESTPVD